MRREGIEVTWCRVELLMRTDGLRGISRSKRPRTIIPVNVPDNHPELVERDFTATVSNQLWVADISPHAGGAPSYCRTFGGWAYTAFVVDVLSPRVTPSSEDCLVRRATPGHELLHRDPIGRDGSLRQESGPRCEGTRRRRAELLPEGDRRGATSGPGPRSGSSVPTGATPRLTS